MNPSLPTLRHDRRASLHYSPHLWLYSGFCLFVVVVMAIDLALTRKGDIVSTRRALTWTGICVLLALCFVPALYWMYESHWLGLGLEDGRPPRSGFTACAEYLQGWLLEYALSVDNLFVFALIFQQFGVPKQFQHRVLTWGIIATLILRGVMILLGAQIVERWHWVLYIAGAFLVYQGFKMLVSKHDDDNFDIEQSRTVRITRRVLPLTPEYHGERFFIRKPIEAAPPDTRAALFATPLLLVLVVLNIVDIVFAVDSIPAVFVITRDPFVVFTSNVFAVLGLRALYFVLAHMLEQFKYLNVSLAVVLMFIGVKMLTENLAERYLPHNVLTLISLGVIVGSIGLGVLFSLRTGGSSKQAPLSPSTAPPMGEHDAT